MNLDRRSLRKASESRFRAEFPSFSEFADKGEHSELSATFRRCCRDGVGTGSDHDKLLKAEQLTRVGTSFLVLTGDFLASFLAARGFRFVHAVAHAKG